MRVIDIGRSSAITERFEYVRRTASLVGKTLAERIGAVVNNDFLTLGLLCGGTLFATALISIGLGNDPKTLLGKRTIAIAGEIAIVAGLAGIAFRAPINQELTLLGITALAGMVGGGLLGTISEPHINTWLLNKRLQKNK